MAEKMEKPEKMVKPDTRHMMIREKHNQMVLLLDYTIS